MFEQKERVLQGATLRAVAQPRIKLSKLGEDDRLLLIYRAAAGVIHAKGYDATSLNDIAEAVGITKGGLYHYIDGKQSLLFKIMSYALDLLDAEVVTPAGSLVGAEQQLRSVIQLHTQLIVDKGIELTILLDESAGLAPDHLRLITQRRVTYYKFVRAIIQRLKDEGKLRELDVTIATHNLMGQLQWLPRWYTSGGRLTREQVIDGFTQAALTAVLRAGSSSRAVKRAKPASAKGSISKSSRRRK